MSLIIVFPEKWEVLKGCTNKCCLMTLRRKQKVHNPSIWRLWSLIWFLIYADDTCMQTKNSEKNLVYRKIFLEFVECKILCYWKVVKQEELFCDSVIARWNINNVMGNFFNLLKLNTVFFANLPIESNLHDFDHRQPSDSWRGRCTSGYLSLEYHVKLQAKTDVAVSSFCLIQLALSAVGFLFYFL